jgi:ribonucleoside-diphosphate reductase alpha chain
MAAEHTNGQEQRGLKIRRFYTKARQDPYETVKWSRRTSRITNPDGTVIFEMTDAEVPEHWSQVATDIVVSKYFRKAGVPQLDEQGRPILDDQGNPVLGPERSVRQVVRRLVGCWRDWGERYGYFATAEDAQAFEDELAYMLLHQIGAPNSPQWFNTGLYWAYGIAGPPQGHWYVDPETGELRQSPDAYSHPSAHACFIQSVEDDLVNPGGIFDLVLREARVFKYGAGSGTNFSKIRAEGEPLSGGGTSSGLMSFLKVFDRAAGAIKSGGTTRRAAKMVVVDIDHPDIEKFIRWKAEEEKKVAALVAAGYSADFNGEAYATVSGQNSNNSVRVPDEFIRAVLEDRDWHLRWRTDGRIVTTVRARELWQMIAEAAWQCADPGIQYDTTINDWHTCPASGRINASNPCSEYMFLDDTACNLASLNLLKFYDAKSGRFDIAAFRHAVRLWTIVLEITVLMAQYPSREIAWNSYRFRTLGLGYANLGSLLMTMGLPYDSDRARAVAAAITAIMTGETYTTSAEMAAILGPFPAFPENREHMLRVIRNHRRAAYDAHPEEYEGFAHRTARTGCHALSTRTRRGCPRGLGSRSGTRGTLRVSERSSDAPGTDRDDRLAHGLRYDRDRAGLCARQVQEARRWWLLQDRQPLGRAGAGAPWLYARADSGHLDLCARHAPTRRRPAHQPRDAASARLDRGRVAAHRGCSAQRVRAPACLLPVRHRRSSVAPSRFLARAVEPAGLRSSGRARFYRRGNRGSQRRHLWTANRGGGTASCA